MSDAGLEECGGTVLVLGGGGARGFAHFGVLRVLEEAHIHVDRIVGVSIGAFVGALYCQTPAAEEISARVRAYVESEQFRVCHRLMTRASRRSRPKDAEGLRNGHAEELAARTPWFDRIREYFHFGLAVHKVFSQNALLSLRPMEDCLAATTAPGNIENLDRRLTIVAADLRSGDSVHLDSGDLHSAVLGSTALPGIFPPVERDGHLLADFGVLCSTPVMTARRYRPDKIIAVDLTPRLEPKREFRSGLEIINRMEEMGAFHFKEEITRSADLIIRPDVGHIDWADFHDMDRVVELGARATTQALGTSIL